MSSSNTATANEYTLDEFLTLCLITFNSAVKAYRHRSVTSFSLNPHNETVLDVDYSDDVTSLGEFPARTPEVIEKAFRKWNLCDHFCLFLYRFLRDWVEKYGYTVTWANVRARPKYTFLLRYTDQLQAQDHLKDLRHSILLIRTKNGRTIAFDGTPEQFGWGESSSIMDKESYWDQHVEGDGDEWKDVGDTDEQDPADMRRDYGEYWVDVFEELLEMLAGVKFDEVVKLEPVERKEFIREASESKAFAVASRFWR